MTQDNEDTSSEPQEAQQVWEQALAKAPSYLRFMQEIAEQVPEQVRGVFHGILNDLTEFMDEETEENLARYEALVDYDVESWDEYHDAMAAAGLEEDHEDVSEDDDSGEDGDDSEDEDETDD